MPNVDLKALITGDVEDEACGENHYNVKRHISGPSESIREAVIDLLFPDPVCFLLGPHCSAI